MSLEHSILEVDNIFKIKNSISFITKKNNKYKNQELLQKVLNYKNSPNEIEKKLYELKKCHRISAGKITRPLKTRKIMLKKIL